MTMNQIKELQTFYELSRMNSTGIGRLQLQRYTLMTSAKTVDGVYPRVLTWEQRTFESGSDIYITCVLPPGLSKIFPPDTKLLETCVLLGDYK